MAYGHDRYNYPYQTNRTEAHPVVNLDVQPGHQDGDRTGAHVVRQYAACIQVPDLAESPARTQYDRSINWQQR